jgi:uncharacterized membrane protein YhfC
MANVAVAAQAAQQTTLQQGFSNLVADGERAARDFSIWAMRLQDGEKLILLCLFILLLLTLIVYRVPKQEKSSRSTEGQFFFAFVLVVIVSFGAGWIFDGRISIPGYT